MLLLPQNTGFLLTTQQVCSAPLPEACSSCVALHSYAAKELRACLRYLRDDAPLIIHISMAKMQRFLTSDTHYRNQFETGTSAGTLSRVSRTDWEDRLFKSMYHDAADSERVK